MQNSFIYEMILKNNLRRYINNISILIKLYVLVNLFVSNIKNSSQNLLVN